MFLAVFINKWQKKSRNDMQTGRPLEERPARQCDMLKLLRESESICKFLHLRISHSVRLEAHVP